MQTSALSFYYALAAQTCARHARDVTCQRFGLSQAELSRLILADHTMVQGSCRENRPSPYATVSVLGRPIPDSVA